MKLSEIRQADRAKLIQAMQELIQAQGSLTLGEMHATSRTIMDRWLSLGLSLGELNALARGEMKGLSKP